MELINLLWSGLTGYSLGYLGVYYRTKEYHKYFPILIYIYFILSAYKMNIDMTPIIFGFVICVLTVVYTYDPILPNGCKVYNKEYSIFYKDKS